MLPGIIVLAGGCVSLVLFFAIFDLKIREFFVFTMIGISALAIVCTIWAGIHAIARHIID